VTEDRYPVIQRGWFHSANPRLDQIWQMGVNTLYASMQDAYADPWRERGQWWGDAYVADHLNQVVFGDNWLLRRGLLLMAESLSNGQPAAFAPNGDGSQMLDYSMLWVQSVQDYAMRSGDQNLLWQIYPAVRTFMTYLEQLRNPTTRLLDIAPGHWSRTALIDWAGAESRSGQSTALNALYYGTLLDAADLAAMLHDTASAATWRQTAQTVKEQINAILYLPDQGRYATSILNGALVAPTTHAQAWPLALAVTEPAQRDPVATALLDPFQVEIFGMYWVLEGLANAGHIDDATGLIEEHYGKLLDQGATSLWEHWDSNLRYRAALSHSWGGSPTWFLTTRLLGAQPTGLNQWIVQPAFAGVTWAAGALPLPTGDLQVEWQQPTCTERNVTVNAPPNSNGDILVPFADLIELRLNGITAWIGGNILSERVAERDNLLQIHSTGGSDVVQMTRRCTG
jgi:alpha-L-rhamnosidase